MAATEPTGEGDRTGVRVSVSDAARRTSSPACRCSTTCSCSSPVRRVRPRARGGARRRRRTRCVLAGRALGEGLAGRCAAGLARARLGDRAGRRGARARRARGLGSRRSSSRNVDLSTRPCRRARQRRRARASSSELADGAGLTLHVRLIDGDDTQHVLEAIFKALGVALAQACRPRGREESCDGQDRRPHGAAPRRRSRGRRTRRRSATGDLVFVSGQLALQPGDASSAGGSIQEQTEQIFAQPAARSSRRPAAGSTGS